MWSETAVLCVFYTTSKQFWRSAESRYVYLPPPHVSHMDDVAKSVEPLPCLFVVDQELAMWSETAVLCVFYTTSKQFWRSAESRYVYLLPPHVSHMDDVAPYVEPFPYRFVVDQELVMWSKIVENGHFVLFFTPPRSSLRDN